MVWIRKHCPHSLFFLAFFGLGLILSSCAKPKSPSGNLVASTPNSKPQESTCPYRLQPQDLCLNYSWLQFPKKNLKGQLLVKLFRPHKIDGSPVWTDVPWSLTATLWMPSMGHGSVPTLVQKVEVGSYLVDRVYFTMPGDWVIYLRFFDGNSLIDEVTLEFFVTEDQWK